MVKRSLIGIFLLTIIFLYGCNQEKTVAGKSFFQQKGVTIADKGNYYSAVLDYTSGLTRRQMGWAFATGILQMIPDYEALVDSYIAENLAFYEYHEAFFRVDDVKLQLDQDYRDEIEGMASKFSGGRKNIRGDKKLSRDEFYMFNLFPDVIRGSQCTFVSVFGSRSATGKNITARNLDWYGGSRNQLPRMQGIITIKYPGKSICSIGYLGYMGIITAFNSDKVFAAILDAATGEAYSSQGKRSYPLDLRYALEHENTTAQMAAFMRDPLKIYAVNHIIAFSDPVDSMILENNLSGPGTTQNRVKRALRYSVSRLNNGVTWGISGAVASVNSFLLYGNNDNHTANKYNTRRWKNLKKQLLAKGKQVTAGELKEVVAYDGGSPGTFSDSGDLYNKMTLQSMIFEPDTLSLRIWFFPRHIRKIPRDPVFEKVKVFQ